MKNIIFSLIFFSIMARSEQSQLVFISGASDKASLPRYFNSASSMMRLSQDNSIQSKFFFNTGLIINGNKMDEAYRANILKYFDSIRNHDSKLVLFFSGHGEKTSDSRFPAGGEIILPSKEDKTFLDKLSFSDFSLNLPKDEGKHTFIIGSQCYSGSIHEISFGRKKTCSLASTNYMSRALAVESATENKSLFVDAFIKENKQKNFDVDNNGSTSVFESFLSICQYDHLNFDNISLSSKAFAQKELKTDAYDLSWFESTKKTEEILLNSKIENCKSNSNSYKYKSMKSSLDEIVYQLPKEVTDQKLFILDTKKSDEKNFLLAQNILKTLIDKLEKYGVKNSYFHNALTFFNKRMRDKDEFSVYALYGLLNHALLITSFLDKITEKDKVEKMLSLIECENENLF